MAALFDGLLSTLLMVSYVVQFQLRSAPAAPVAWASCRKWPRICHLSLISWSTRTISSVTVVGVATSVVALSPCVFEYGRRLVFEPRYNSPFESKSDAGTIWFGNGCPRYPERPAAASLAANAGSGTCVTVGT